MKKVFDKEITLFTPFSEEKIKTTRKKSRLSLPSSMRQSKHQQVESYTTILSILCINCQELVSIDKIENHSKFCIRLTNDVCDLEKSTILEELIFKMTKLKKCLDQVSTNPELKPGDKNYILILLRLLTSVLNNPEKEEIDKARSSLSSVSTTFRGGLSILVYIDRLQELIRQFSTCINDETLNAKMDSFECSSSYSDNLLKEKSAKKLSLDIPSLNFNDKVIISPKSSNGKLITKQLSPRDSDKKILHSPSPSRLPNKRYLNVKKTIEIHMNKPIDDIDSGLGSESFGTASIISTLYNANDTPCVSPLLDNSEHYNDESLRKYFYSLCLSLKIKFTNKNTKKNISTQKLYKVATDRNIPPDQWWEFLNQEFEIQNPEFFQGPIRRKANIKQCQYFETIIEETA